MKIVINRRCGGFDLPQEFKDKYNIKWGDDIERTDERLVKWVEDNLDVIVYNEDYDDYVSKCDFEYSSLRVFEIPDNSTDYYIEEYDGDETILYVIDGKINKLD